MRTVKTKEGMTQIVEIDFLSGEYGGTSESHRTQKVQDIRARKARGCDLAFQNNLPVSIKKKMPDCSINEVNIRSCSKLVIEGLGKTMAKFNDINAAGPVWIVNFEGVDDEEEKERVKRDAYERVNGFLEELRIEEFSEAYYIPIQGRSPMR